jgi:endonuclease I
MNIHNLFKSSVASMMLVVFGTAYAGAPTNYYSSCEGKSGQELLTALYNTITNHTTVSYDDLFSLYSTTDVRANGTLWDMYSTKEWTISKSNQCGNYSVVGDCYNREHSMPKSWFNDAKPMYSDAFHVYPTDGKVNGQRSNYPYGECENGTTLASNGSVKALGKLGASTFDGYTGTVFEPDDEYKGDLARTYFYMAACYNDRIKSWSSDMLAQNNYPVFTTWALNLLLKWHNQDPVSQKELDRNEAVYAAQKNRNPFIDHPELVDYIWGTKTDESWTSAANNVPELNRPINGTTYNMGTVAVGVAATYTVNVKGLNLKSDLTVSFVSGSSLFSASPATIKAADAITDAGKDIVITYTATAEGINRAIFKVSNADVSSEFEIMATAKSGLPASDATNIFDDSFTANWTYIGDTDSNGCYTLDVRDANGSIDGYPRKVDAARGYYVVDGLDASTGYTYTVSSETLTSEAISLVTLAPIPAVSFLYDGELFIESKTDEPSEPIELLVDMVNISSNVTLTVNEPFQLSTDKTEWSNTAVLSPEEDRVYVRLNSSTNGSFMTVLSVYCGDYFNDEVVIEGKSSKEIGLFVEDFETEGLAQYTAFDYDGDAAAWSFSNAGFWPTQDTSYSGSQALRLKYVAEKTYLTMNEDKEYGAGTVELYARRYGSDTNATIELYYSTDKGETWTSAGQASVTATSYEKYTFTVNQVGDVRIKIEMKAGKRMMIDYLTISDYNTTNVSNAEYYHTWDAFSNGGQLIIEMGQADNVAVYGVDGITYYDGKLAAGTTKMSLAKGLYIVSVGDFTRRVLVK